MLDPLTLNKKVIMTPPHHSLFEMISTSTVLPPMKYFLMASYVIYGKNKRKHDMSCGMS